MNSRFGWPTVRIVNAPGSVCDEPPGGVTTRSYVPEPPAKLNVALIRELRADDERERIRLEDLAVRVAALLSFDVGQGELIYFIGCVAYADRKSVV